MVKLSDRSIFIGLLAIGLSIAILSLLWKNDGHRAEEQNWSTQPRASVSTGPVREEIASAPVAAERENVDPPIAKEVDDSSSGEIAIDLQSAGSQARVESRAPQSRVQAKTEKKPRTSHAAAPVRQAKNVAPEARDVQSTESNARVSNAASESPVDTAAKRVEPRVSVPEPIANAPQESLQQEPPPSANVAQPEVRTAQAPVEEGSSRPKTRKDVENEVRKARMDGSLPRFGNPDPYGPGGSPSQSD